mgnify:CR=1 FL=1
MSKVFEFFEGSTPLLVSVPHDGWQIPADIVQHMSEAGRAITDTDWHVAELYGFVKASGASMIAANFSRYVVDLNRPADDAELYPGSNTPGLCPSQTFAGADIYLEPIEIDRAARVANYWQPYHDKIRTTLQKLKDQHGHALLWDAHSIPSQVPSLFDGELPVLNIGTWDGRSCAPKLSDAVMAAAGQSDYDAVLNGRFKGGFITRNYGDPDAGVHALQLELAQRVYMHERTLEFDREKADTLRATLRSMLEAYQEAAAQ